LAAEHIAIVAPCFNEGEVAVRFAQELEQVLSRLEQRFTLVLVDDGSSDGTGQQLLSYQPAAGNVSLRVIGLPFNMGHQEAIHQGLLFAEALDAQRFIVMDSDGEDDPGAIAELVGIADASVAFVARGKRSEGLGFRMGWRLYRVVFRLVARRALPFGNYSMIDRRALSAVLHRSFTHYAAFLSRLRVPQRSIVRDRRPRIDGNSKMSWRSLSMHAFRSLIEYSEEAVALFLRASIALAAVFILSIFGIIGVKLFTSLAIPGWASVLSATLFNSVLLCVGFFALGLLLVSHAQRRDRAQQRLYTELTPAR
jgi:glycosyltransferase involved in cell wall biosynthesis